MLRAAYLPCGVIAILCMLGSCAEIGPDEASIARGLEGDLVSDTTSLGIPTALIDRKGHRIVLEGRLGSTGTALTVYDSNGHLITQRGRVGSGPGEFRSPVSLIEDTERDANLWVFDSGLMRMTSIGVEPLIEGSYLEVGDIIPIKAMVGVGSPAWLNDTVMVALGAPQSSGDGRFVRIRQDGELLATFGPPPPGDSVISPFVRQQVYGGRILVDPDRNRIVVPARYASFIDVFDYNGRQVSRLESPEPFIPDYSVAPDGINMVRGENFRFGYLDVALSRDRLYGLYSGRTRREHPETQYLANEIHVFTWDGKLTGRYVLDRSGLAIALGENPGELFVSIIDPVPQIRRYSVE